MSARELLTREQIEELRSVLAGDGYGVFQERDLNNLCDMALLSIEPQGMPVAWIVSAKDVAAVPRYLNWKREPVGMATAEQCEFTPLYEAAPPRVSDWMPIESAPENEIVLIVCANETMWIASRHDDEWILMGDGIYVEIEPTHWQPLPPPPHGDVL